MTLTDNSDENKIEELVQWLHSSGLFVHAHQDLTRRALRAAIDYGRETTSEHFPELLAACERLSEDLEDGHWSNTKRHLRELVSKARGE